MTRPFVIDINHANNVQDTPGPLGGFAQVKASGIAFLFPQSDRGVDLRRPALWGAARCVDGWHPGPQSSTSTARFCKSRRGLPPIISSTERIRCAKRSFPSTPQSCSPATTPRSIGRLCPVADPAERRCGRRRRVLQHRRKRAWLPDHCLFGQCRQGAAPGQGSALCQAPSVARRLQQYLVGSADLGPSVALAEQRRQSRQRTALYSRDRRQLRQLHRRRADDRQAVRRRLGRRRAADRDRGHGAQARRTTGQSSRQTQDCALWLEAGSPGPARLFLRRVGRRHANHSAARRSAPAVSGRVQSRPDRQLHRQCDRGRARIRHDEARSVVVVHAVAPVHLLQRAQHRGHCRLRFRRLHPRRHSRASPILAFARKPSGPTTPRRRSPEMSLRPAPRQRPSRIRSATPTRSAQGPDIHVDRSKPRRHERLPSFQLSIRLQLHRL